MAKFRQFYNAGHGDSTLTMFPPGSSNFLWNNERIGSVLQEPGTINTFKFIGIDKSDPDRVWVFKTVFSKVGPKTTSLTLYKNN